MNEKYFLSQLVVTYGLEDRGWDGWMASLTLWTWVCVNSGSWWWTGRPSVLRLIHAVAKSRTQLGNWTELNWWPGMDKKGHRVPFGSDEKAFKLTSLLTVFFPWPLCSWFHLTPTLSNSSLILSCQDWGKGGRLQLKRIQWSCRWGKTHYLLLLLLLLSRFSRVQLCATP